MTPPTSAWAAAVSGSWSNAGNWTGAVPNAVGAGAVINVPTAAALTITLDAPQTLGTLLLGNSAAAGVGYTLSGTGSNTLTLNNSGNGATITVTDGTHAINAPVVLNDNLTVNNNGSLTLGGAIANGSNGPMGITISGSGLLVLAGGNTYSGNTTDQRRHSDPGPSPGGAKQHRQRDERRHSEFRRRHHQPDPGRSGGRRQRCPGDRRLGARHAQCGPKRPEHDLQRLS